jgi:hypothetical protein
MSRMRCTPWMAEHILVLGFINRNNMCSRIILIVRTHTMAKFTKAKLTRAKGMGTRIYMAMIHGVGDNNDQVRAN